ncbi:MAG TPA: arginine biosynthesis protein ArgJ [Planctomycetaceae bacterium]|nr:arginine biosynthesis protein ArgJ [Planctomycetaceae bacterium]
MTHQLPQGFQTAGVTCGIKESGKPDLAAFVSEVPAATAGVFAQNRVLGAPVLVSRERVPRSDCRAVIINSGNANACTGDSGLADARQMTEQLATQLECSGEQVLVCSTGIIGVPLPMDVITAGIPQAAAALADSPESLESAATAMMTTDTFAKFVSEEVELSSGSVRVTGAAKGAAMIAPNMATMLCVVMTDADLTAEQTDSLIRYGVDRTFNCISVDGHMSTSDSVILMANGTSGHSVDGSDEDLVRNAVQRICQKLATDIIRDAEGAAHFVTVDVQGFDTRETAFRIAKEIAESALVKTAICGNDPNWGRITSAAGYAGINFDVAHLSLTINDVEVYRAGTPVKYDEAALSEKMAQEDVHLLLELAGGPCSGSESVRFWTSDLTQEYVRLNSEYTT